MIVGDNSVLANVLLSFPNCTNANSTLPSWGMIWFTILATAFTVIVQSESVIVPDPSITIHNWILGDAAAYATLNVLNKRQTAESSANEKMKTFECAFFRILSFSNAVPYFMHVIFFAAVYPEAFDEHKSSEKVCFLRILCRANAAKQTKTARAVPKGHSGITLTGITLTCRAPTPINVPESCGAMKGPKSVSASTV